MKRKIIIMGATSAIAQEVAKQYADSSDLFLVGRNSEKLQTIANDLHVRGNGQVAYHTMDLNHCEAHPKLLEHAQKVLGHVDVLLIAHGSLSNQKKCESSYEETLKELNTNCLSVISLLTVFANYFEQRKQGTIAVISSVAGDRGRQSNYIYGAAKGALTIYLQGLRNRLKKSNVEVLTIKPGFVDTPMIAHLKKGLLWASPGYVAAKIVNAIEKKQAILYVPFFWRYIMLIIKLIPEKMFCRLSL